FLESRELVVGAGRQLRTQPRPREFVKRRRLRPGPGKQHKQTEDHGSGHPDRDDHAGAESRADRMCSLSVVSDRGLRGASHSGDEPPEHEDVPEDEGPFEHLAEKSPFWGTDGKPAPGTLVSCGAHLRLALRTSNQCHLCLALCWSVN